jgi:dGTPase
MFEHVYLGRQVEPQHREAERVVRAIFTRLADEPELLPPGEGDLAERITDYLAGMTDRFALAYAERLASE